MPEPEVKQVQSYVFGVNFIVKTDEEPMLDDGEENPAFLQAAKAQWQKECAEALQKPDEFPAQLMSIE